MGNKLFFSVSFFSVVFFSVGFVCAQHYDYGQQVQYFKTPNLVLDTIIFRDSTHSQYSNSVTKEIIYSVNANKTIKKTFNHHGNLIEELVFLNKELVSGIEYFINPTFPFLKSPRSFVMRTIEHNEVSYENIKSNIGLIEYVPQSKIAILRLRIYTNNKRKILAGITHTHKTCVSYFS